MSLRRVGIALACTAVVASLVAAVGSPAAAAAGGGVCRLQGIANISPPLSSSAGAFDYSFTGNLGDCHSSIAGAPTSGTAAAGTQLSESVTLTDNTTGATSTGTVTYQQPIPHGNGSCGDSTTSGQALITWGNNNHTVVGYNTTGAAAAVELQGSVIASTTLTLVPSSVPAGFSAPSTYTITTDEPSFPVGQSGLAALTFSPTTQDQDCVTKGVSSANIDGLVGIGSSS